MTSTVGYAALDIIPSVKGLAREISAQTSGLDAAGRKAGAKFGDAASREAGNRFKSRFGGIAKEIAVPFAAAFAGAGALEFFKGAIEGASDLNESATKTQAIFGDATAQIQKFAAESATALGQTRVQALDAAAQFGTFGKAAGLSGEDLAGFSEKLVGLSADLASFYNTSPQQAIEAIGAALRGEAEPIRSYGVLLDDATLRQEALRQGLIATTKQALSPQQKVLAANAVIFKQTSDAQGDFARTSGGLANQQRILAARFKELQTELGAKLLPATVGFVSFLNDDAVPALETVGGAVGDAARFFNGLPTPVKAATGALVAFRVAQATGLTSTFSSGLATLGSSFDNLRERGSVMADAFRTARRDTIELTATAQRHTPGLGRFAAGLEAVKVGSLGAGSAIKSGLGGAVNLLGGPWGLAIAAGTAALTYFWQQHQKAKQFVDDLTASLDKQTGALTDNTRETIFKSLQDSGAIEAAKRLGIGLDDLRAAAEGNDQALAIVNSRLNDFDAIARGFAGRSGDPLGLSRAFKDEDVQAADTLRGAIGATSGALADARTNAKDFGQFMGGAATATGETGRAAEVSAGGFRSLASQVGAAKDAVKALLQAENNRRTANLQNRQDALALRQALADTRKEAREGKATLNTNTQEGRDNLSALYRLAEQFNGSSKKVRNAKGAYESFRRQFVDVAISMGDTRKEAQKLADQIIRVPKKAVTKVETPGMAKALKEAERLRILLLEQNTTSRTNVVRRRRGSQIDAFASGGRVGGHGIGDKRMILADPREWVINPRAVDFYGNGLMDAINRMQLPRFAQGGPVGGTQVSIAAGSSQMTGVLQIAPDGLTAHVQAVVRQEFRQRDAANRRSGISGGAR